MIPDRTSLISTLRQLAPAIGGDYDRTVTEAFDVGAYEKARLDERLTIIAYESARSVDPRLRAWTDLAPSERRLWRGRRAALVEDHANKVGRLETPSSQLDRAWLVFGTITSALYQATPDVLAEALAVFDAEVRRRPPPIEEDARAYRRVDDAVGSCRREG